MDDSILRGAAPHEPAGDERPTKLARLTDAGLSLETEDEAALSPTVIAARVLLHPFKMDAHQAVVAMAPPVGATKGTNVSIGHFNVAVANKVTPAMLLAIVVNIIADSASAAEAVQRIRIEVRGWEFESSTGERG